MPARKKEYAGIVVHMRAVDCLHWNRPDVQGKAPSLKDRGFSPQDLVGTECLPDLGKLTRKNKESLAMLGEMLGEMDASQTRILLKVLVDSTRLNAMGLWFGQPLYWCSTGNPSKSYLDQWFSCYAVGARNGKVVISAMLDKADADSLLEVSRKSLLPNAAFQTKKRKLEKEGRTRTPPRNRGSLLAWSEEGLEGAPPGLEDVLERARSGA